MNTYDLSGALPKLWDLADNLAKATEPDDDCLSGICSLSEEGEWMNSANGVRAYHAPVEAEERSRPTETGVLPVESYKQGDTSIPTLVARRFGLGEQIVCKNAGHLLQGDNLIDRPVHRGVENESGKRVVVLTSLREILEEESDENIYWRSLEWRHVQSIVDASGGQLCRFELLSSVFKRLAEAGMDSETFVAYGNEFADSDFVDSF